MATYTNYEKAESISSITRYSFFFLILITICIYMCPAAYAETLASGASLTAITNDGKSLAVTYSPREDKILIKRKYTDTQKQLFIANSDGSDEEAITPIGNPYYAEWSWKGDKIAYLFSNADDSESQANAFIYDLNTQKTITVTGSYKRSNLDENEGPAWSPDDRYLAFKTRRGPSQINFVTVYDTVENTCWDIAAERGDNRAPKWSITSPAKLAFLTKSSSGYYDIAVSDPAGRKINFLTNNGAESITNWHPQWRPACKSDELVIFTSNKEMTRSERENRRSDVWAAKPDCTLIQNLTEASSPSSENQMSNSFLKWSWDGKWILSKGDRYNAQGRGINTLYLIDPDKGGYKKIFTTDPEKDGQLERERLYKWSWDSRYILLYTQRHNVKNWGTEPEYQRTRHIISMIDAKTFKREEILLVDEDLDRKQLLGSDYRFSSEDISFSPDGRSILLTIAEIISSEEGINRPDVYRLELPKKYWNSQLVSNPGPPVGTATAKSSAITIIDITPEESTVSNKEVTPAATDQDCEIVTEVIKPKFMTIDEAAESLSSSYSQYFTSNTTRNLLLFKGPKNILEELKSDLSKIDFEPPQILVDLLAVELSDEANRELGLDWTVAKGRFALFQPAGRAIRDLTPDASLGGMTTFPGAGQAFYQGVGSLPTEFFVRLSAMVKDGQGTILANPRTVAMSGHESSINIRKTVNFFFTEGYDTSGRPIVKKSDISADTIGRITPTLLPNGKINLCVDIGVGSFTFTEVSGLPEQTQRQSTTEITVEQGQTIIIGGLRQQEMSTSVNKVPLLGDLPFVGNLFKTEKADVKNSVLTIFITPHVLQTNEPAPEWEQIEPDDHQIVPIMKDSYPSLKDFFDNEQPIKVKED